MCLYRSLKQTALDTITLNNEENASNLFIGWSKNIIIKIYYLITKIKCNNQGKVFVKSIYVYIIEV